MKMIKYNDSAKIFINFLCYNFSINDTTIRCNACLIPNNSHEITMNGHQARIINEVRNVILSSLLWETFLSVKGRSWDVYQVEL